MSKSISISISFDDWEDAVTDGRCPACGNSVRIKSLRDTLSRKEYKISGLCQKCQDEVFGA